MTVFICDHRSLFRSRSAAFGLNSVMFVSENFSNQYSSTQLFKFGILVIEQILLFLNILTVHIEKDENRWIHFII